MQTLEIGIVSVMYCFDSLQHIYMSADRKGAHIPCPAKDSWLFLRESIQCQPLIS